MVPWHHPDILFKSAVWAMIQQPPISSPGVMGLPDAHAKETQAVRYLLKWVRAFA